MSYLDFYRFCIIFYIVIERALPMRRDQEIWRRQYVSDWFYVVINGHFIGVLLYGVSAAIENYFNTSIFDLQASFGFSILKDLSITEQVIYGMLIKDFFSWCVHNLLHRVPVLWQLHKVHHSAPDMDFMVVMRFHWLEIMVYKFFLYLPLLIAGISGEAMIYIILINVFWGFYNHSNLNIPLGPLKYIFNSPQMHLWHHEFTTDRMNLNFGVTLSLWDWIFGTVYWPKGEKPKKLGFAGMENYPKNFFTQYLYPIRIKWIDREF